MKTLSSIELSHLIKELQTLVGSRFDSASQKGKEEVLLTFHKSNEGKQLLRILVGKLMFVGTRKEEEESGHFSSLLRTHLDGLFLSSLSQIQPERIVKLDFGKKEGITHTLYAEFLSKGNLVLCKDGIIIDALERQEFKDRKLVPKEAYKHPQSQYNVFSLEENELASMLLSTKRDSLVKAIAVELGMGGQVAEEIVALAGVEKTTAPKDVSEEERKKVFSAIKELLARSCTPRIIIEQGMVSDVMAFALRESKGEAKEFATWCAALEEYSSTFKGSLKSSHDGRLAQLRIIIAQQEENIRALELEEVEERKKAEAIYSNYQEMDAILKELREIAKNHSWQEIQEKLKGHKKIVMVNPKEKSVVIEID